MARLRMADWLLVRWPLALSVSVLAAFAGVVPGVVLSGPAIASASDLTETREQPETREQRANPSAAEQLLEDATPPGAVDALTDLTDTSAVSQVLRLELHLSERRLAVYQGEMLIANYSVAVGREGWQTPTGEFSVFQKQQNPAWEHPFTGEIVPPGPDNPLGTRWIGFWSDGENAIGFHGTPDESVIGSAVSHGCVRMRNEDVLALYEQVSVDTPVIVLP